MTAAELALDLMEVAALLATLALIQTGCRMSRIACLGSCLLYTSDAADDC